MPTSDLIFIIGRQRSGTTVFRDLLARHGAVNCDEIFHGDFNEPYRFYEFVLERAKIDHRAISPLRHRGLFWDYIENMREIANGRKLAMDLKYFALNLIPQLEDFGSQMPFMIEFMGHSRANVVHIIRRNKLRVYVSEQMSEATGKWSAEKIEHLATEKPKLTVNIEAVLEFIELLNKQDEHVMTLLESVPNIERLYYDEMFNEAGLFTPKVQHIAKRFMDLEEVNSKPGNLKMNPEPLSELVGNYDELAQALAGTDYSWMLKDPN